MTLFHGTTRRAAENIIRNGFGKSEKVWACSHSNHVYMVDTETVYNESEALRIACEAGQIAAAKFGDNNTNIVIFGFEFPSETADAYLMPDWSCPNADGCWCIETTVLNRLIEDGTVKQSVKVVKDGYIPYMRPFYLTNLSDEYMKIEDSFLRQILHDINSIDVCFVYDSILCCTGTQTFDKLPDFEPAAEPETEFVSSPIGNLPVSRKGLEQAVSEIVKLMQVNSKLAAQNASIGLPFSEAS